MIERYVVGSADSVSGLYDTREEAERYASSVSSGTIKYEVWKVYLSFTERFMEWYNERIEALGEDIYRIDGDCLLAGTEEGAVVGYDYLISNLEWVQDTDADNISYLKEWREEGWEKQARQIRKHTKLVQALIDDIRSYKE